MQPARNAINGRTVRNSTAAVALSASEATARKERRPLYDEYRSEAVFKAVKCLAEAQAERRSGICEPCADI
jgi:hypothetical protein